MTHLTGTLKVKQWDEAPYDAPAGLPKLTRAAVTHELTGDVEGEASITYLMAYRADGTAGFVGLVRVTGTVAGHTGTFVMEDVGTYENGVAKGRWAILPALGTGELRTLRGEGHFAASSETASFQLDVDFE
jgi:hypothetical protein